MDDACELPVEGGDYFGSGQLPSSHDGVALAPGSWILQEASAPTDRATVEALVT
jgi:hypothetical protein